MKTTHIILALTVTLLLSALQPFSPSAPCAGSAGALPPLPQVTPTYDAKAYAWAWDAPTQAWVLLPRNEARILNRPKEDGSFSKQLVGTLTIDGCYDVPVVSGNNVLLAFRMNSDYKTFNPRPAANSGGTTSVSSVSAPAPAPVSEFEVVKLDVTPGPRKNQLIRTAQLQRLGESAATFGAKREPVTVWQSRRQDGIFHVVRVECVLPPGRYAFYLPDRAFEFEVK